MKRKFIISSILSLLLLSFSGCSIKDADTCEMKHTKIIFNLNLDDDTPESLAIVEKIQAINPSYDISNRKTNIIKTSFAEATEFYETYKSIIKEENNKIKKDNSEFTRHLNNSFNVSTNDCETKTLYIDGIDKQIISNAEYIITLSN